MDTGATHRWVADASTRARRNPRPLACPSRSGPPSARRHLCQRSRRHAAERPVPLAGEHLPCRGRRRSGDSGRDCRLDRHAGRRRRARRASTLREATLAAPSGAALGASRRAAWAVPKTDRLLIPSGAMATKFVILDAVRQRRGNRDYIINKPYARIVARLAPVSKADGQSDSAVQPVQALRQHHAARRRRAAPTARTGCRTSRSSSCSAASCPSEDGQELEAQEVADVVARCRPARTSRRAAAGLPDATGRDRRTCAAGGPPELLPPYTPCWPRPRYEPTRQPTTSTAARCACQGAARRHPAAHAAARSAPRPGRPAP